MKDDQAGKVASKENEPDHNLADKRGLLPLHLVLRAGEDFLETAGLFIQRQGADPEIKRGKGRSAVQLQGIPRVVGLPSSFQKGKQPHVF